jgi:hypothetical protein
MCAAVIWGLDPLRRRLLGRRMICPPSHSRYGVAFESRQGPSGNWGSTAAAILSLQALVWAADGVKHKGLTLFSILVNGKEVKQGEVTAANADMLQMIAFKEQLRLGVNEMLRQIRHGPDAPPKFKSEETPRMTMVLRR